MFCSVLKTNVLFSRLTLRAALVLNKVAPFELELLKCAYLVLRLYCQVATSELERPEWTSCTAVVLAAWGCLVAKAYFVYDAISEHLRLSKLDLPKCTSCSASSALATKVALVELESPKYASLAALLLTTCGFRVGAKVYFVYCT